MKITFLGESDEVYSPTKKTVNNWLFKVAFLQCLNP